MNELVKDIKILTTYSKVIRGISLIKMILTVGIIVFSVLEGVRCFYNSDTFKSLPLNIK